MYTESKTLNRFVVFIVKDNKVIDYSSLVEDRYLTRVVHKMSYDSNIVTIQLLWIQEVR